QVPQRGIPPPASLLAVNAMEMKDGQMFHVLTYGWSLRLLPLVNVERQRVFFCPTFCGELLRALPALVGETDFQRVTVEFVDSDRGPLPVIYGDRSIVRPGLLARIYGQRSLERRAPDTDG